MALYTAVFIIYNPNSTGPGKVMAQDLKRSLRQAIPKVPITVTPTQHVGHAELLAYEAATATAHPLIISASGDGGYHEVINGLMSAQLKGCKPVAGLLPAGNANDHYRNLHQGDIVENIVNQHERRIDLLKLNATEHGAPLVRYAHSYIGIGLTPKVGRELNKKKLNRLNEVAIVVKELLRLKPVQIKINGIIKTYDSLIFSNVNAMSKVLTISKDATPDDGKFEVTAFTKRTKVSLVTTLLKASTTGLKNNPKRHGFVFDTVKPTLIQLDGEVHTIDGNTPVTISVEPTILPCIV
ncbi:MAG: hypothetical protein NVS1B7_7840 [Candidatus Saccharimonadales bacterium]